MGRTRALRLPRRCPAPRLSFPVHVSLYCFTTPLAVLIVGVRMTTAFVDFNGVVPEKFDAVRLSHLVDAEYGNQGIDFKMVPREGFGWMNGMTDPSFPFPRPDCLLALRSRLPSWPLIPYESHASRSRGVYLAGGLFRSHHDGRAYRRSSLELCQRSSGPCNGEPHAFTHVVWSNWSGIWHSAPFVLATVESLALCGSNCEMDYGSTPSFSQIFIICIV